MSVDWEEINHSRKILKERVKEDPWRLRYHLMPETGWMNDPNGAIQFNGIYHIYHQYVPENPRGGATHWGHKTSFDMVHFKEEEIYLSPENSYDKNGVYSGSAIQKNGKIHFFYTGNVKLEGDHDYTFSGREQNTVHVVSSDGFDIQKREVVIPHDDYPEGYTNHIRDPKVFEHEGRYYMILGARSLENTGAILLYESFNLDKWSYKGNLLDGQKEEGYMWECPDVFDFGDTTILVFSPQGLLPQKHKYLNPHTSGYLMGHINWDELKFEPSGTFEELDKGFDFYAPQTFADESGRRILWAWMGIGDTSPEYVYPTVSRGWQHALTIPRELSLENGILKQRPLPEYKSIRKEETNLQVNDKLEAGKLSGEVYELFIELNNSPGRFALNLRQDIQLFFEDRLLVLEHGPSGYGRRRRYIETDELTELHIFSDTSSLEIFVNDGEHVMSSRIFPNKNKNRIELQTDSQAEIHFWPLENTTKE